MRATLFGDVIASARPPSYLAGAGVLAVAMGFGRFAYTPLLAVMRHDVGLSVALSGILASVNLAGYLCGALAATHRVVRARRYVALSAAAIVVVVTTAAMALPQAWWIPARFVTGVASGVAFVSTVSLFLDRSARDGSPRGVALVFSGVGLGIALAGIAVPALAAIGGSRAAWLGIAAFCAIVLAFALPRIADETPAPVADAATSPAARGADAFGWLCAAYALEGFAYIIPATFLVTMVNEAPDISRYSSFTWVVVGLVAAPAAAMWAALGARVGKNAAFLIAMVVQSLGLLATIVMPGVLGVLVLAVTLGSTFVGITSIAGALAREMRPQATNVAFGILTIAYGVGQIVGPLVAVRATLATGGYRTALALAAASLVVGASAYAASIARPRRSPAT